MTTVSEQTVTRGLRLHMTFEMAISILLIAVLAVMGSGSVHSAAIALAVCAAIVMLYSYLAGILYKKALQGNAKNIARFYLIHSGARIVVYGIASGLSTLILGEAETYRPFLILVAAHFMLTLIEESILFVKLEKRLNENK